MQVIINGFLTDYKGRILLQKVGESALAPVGRPMEPGVLPAETLAHAFREETGLIVMPVRMTGLYYNGGRPAGELIICYRCTLRGGDLAVPDGQPPVGFFDSPPPPRGLSAQYRRQVDHALHHAGGPPVMEREADTWLQRLLGRPRPAADAAAWEISIQLGQAATDDGVVWAISNSAPGQPANAAPLGDDEAPWETAGRLLRDRQAGGRAAAVRLVRAEVAADRPAVNLVFAPSE